uniref:peroxidase n=1 Tax=Rhizophora mucronata TaxID=61149 RepID=A0A2P2Q8D4_RHIMU
MCPNNDGSNTNLVSLDSTAYKFDNVYYGNIVKNTSLLGSDQALLGDPKTAAMVNSYSTDPYLFSGDFAASMVKMGNIGILTGDKGQIRKKCGSVN